MAAKTKVIHYDNHLKSQNTDQKLINQRKKLPVWSLQHEILEAVANNQVVIVVGETGSGKSTQIPQFLLKCRKSIAVTQPRRISAISLADRVSKESSSPLGQLIGYSVRFNECVSANTMIRFMTDGMLLRELVLDKLLMRFDTIILDEVHERTIRTDVLLGFLKNEILPRRPELRLLLMSATVDAEKYCKFFGGCEIPVIFVPGRQFEIRVFTLLRPETDYVDALLRTVYQIHNEMPPGDILAFLNGQDDIESAAAQLKEHAHFVPQLFVHQLYANLPINCQKSVFLPLKRINECANGPVRRKLILATNIAETAVTIPGLRYVIDNGMAKVKRYLPRTGLETLVVEPISQASALQRAGRAGREAPGFVYKLYTQDTAAGLAETSDPEILRTDISSVVLTLKCSGIDNIMEFDFIDKPQNQAIISAITHLTTLGALEKRTQKITDIGISMQKLPLKPILSRILVAAARNNGSGKSLLSFDLIGLVAILSVDTVFWLPFNSEQREIAIERHKSFASPEGDILTWMNVLRGFDASNKCLNWCKQNFVHQRNISYVVQVRRQIEKMLKNFDISFEPAQNEDLVRAFLMGFFSQIAFSQPDGKYVTCCGRHLVNIHPSSMLFGIKTPAVTFVEMISSDSDKWYIRGVSKIDESWAIDASSHLFNNIE